MKRVLISILAVFAMSSVSLADEASRRAAASRFLEASQARRTLDQAMEMMDTMVSQQMGSLDLPAEGRELALEMHEELVSWIGGLFRWEEMSGFMVTTYAEVYSEEELLGMADFYESELGRKFLEKQPELMQKSMVWAQQKMEEIMPEILGRVEAVTAELREKYPEG